MIPIKRTAHLFTGERLWYADGWEASLAEAGIKPNNSLATLTPGEFISGGSPVTNCYRVTLSNGEAVYFKRYTYYIPRIQFWMLPSKAAIEVFGYHAMAQLGMTVPDVVAYGEHRRRGTLFAAYIITKEIPNTITLLQFARDHWYRMPAGLRQRCYQSIADQLCEQMRTLHAAGFFHHDIKWKNVLLQGDANTQPTDLKTIWIDCPRAAKVWLRRRRSQIIDLGRLGRLAPYYLSTKQRLRWLHNYLGEDATKQQVKQLYRQVNAYLDRRGPPHDYELPPANK